MKRYIAEFKSFALKGNVTDLAVGVIIGAAFGKIIESLVGDIVMPLLGIVIGGLDFTKLSFGLGTAQIMYGNFLQALFNLIIVGAALFVMVKAINRMKREKPAENDPAPTPDPADIALLKEIRDLLKK
jgi:large conductance mechanosensitive channel